VVLLLATTYCLPATYYLPATTAVTTPYLPATAATPTYLAAVNKMCTDTNVVRF